MTTKMSSMSREMETDIMNREKINIIIVSYTVVVEPTAAIRRHITCAM